MPTMHQTNIKGHFLFIYEAAYVPLGKAIHRLSWYHTSTQINAFHTCTDDKSIGLSLDRVQTLPSFLPSYSNPSNYRVILSSTCCSLHFSKLYTD